MFHDYLNANDFSGADMARKFLEMGFTRARRYANHHSGKKYDKQKNVLAIVVRKLFRYYFSKIIFFFK